MEVGHIPSQLWRLRLLVLLGIVVAGLGASVTGYRIHLGIPPSFEERSLSRGGGSADLLVDSTESVLGSTHIARFPLESRALVYARLISSESVKADVARKLNIQRASISTTGPPPPGAERGREVSSEVRAQELVNEPRDYRMLAFRGGKGPLVSIFTQAPTPRQARNLANAAATALTSHVAKLQRRQKVGRAARIRFRQLGSAQGHLINQGANKIRSGLVFLGLFVVWCLGVLLASHIATRLRGGHGSIRDELEQWLQPSAAGDHKRPVEAH